MHENDGKRKCTFLFSFYFFQDFKKFYVEKKTKKKKPGQKILLPGRIERGCENHRTKNLSKKYSNQKGRKTYIGETRN